MPSDDTPRIQESHILIGHIICQLVEEKYFHFRPDDLKTCIILAGGFGTRLSHLIPDLPKCLAPVADKPFLHYIIEYLISQQVNLLYLHWVINMNW